MNACIQLIVLLSNIFVERLKYRIFLIVQYSLYTETFSMLITVHFFDNEILRKLMNYESFVLKSFFYLRMTDLPAFLRTHSSRVIPADHGTEENLANESSAGENTADVDFKRLRKIQEVAKKT